MNEEYKKEDIKNIHFNHLNEIQFEYGGQIHHHSMESLKEMFIDCWNLQQENNQLSEKVINQRHALCDTNKKIQVLNARIEKAFKYIDYYVRIDDEHYETLKEILKGEENNNLPNSK